MLLIATASAACAAVAISVGLATGGGALGASAQAQTRGVPATAAPALPVEQPKPVVQSGISAPDGVPDGPVTGGTTVTVSGDDLAGVASVSFGGNPGTVVSATETMVTITTPAATDTGPVTVELFDRAGTAVPVDAAGLDVPATVSAASSAASLPGATPIATEASPPTEAPPAAETPTATAAPEAPTASTVPSASGAAEKNTAETASVAAKLTFTYVPDPRITAQTEYALTHWNDYNTAEFGAIGGNDCVNFTSQSLLARGWTMDAGWSFDSAGSGYSPAWASSTAFAAYLAEHPERATPLTDEQRRRVKVGDIVQFDWDDSGDRDHTGIVTRVDKTGPVVRIYYAGHTANTEYQSVDESLANGGGTVSYWSVK